MHPTLRRLPPLRSAASYHLNASQPTPSNPIVESWLESIHPSPSSSAHRTTTRTTFEYEPFHYAAIRNPIPTSKGNGPFPAASNIEKQWRLVRSALRATSFVVAPVVVIIVFTYREPNLDLDPIWVSITTLVCVTLLYASRGRGERSNWANHLVA